ncbi:MAG: hypothetical protein V4594_17850 [Bacteroidota bacterium]
MKIFKLTLIIFFSLISFRSSAQNSFEWVGSIGFPSGVAKQVAYIDFGDVVLWGSLEVTLSSGYADQNSTGLYRRSYDVGRNLDAVHSNSSEVTSALGPVADQWKLGDFEVSGSNHIRIPLYHLVSSGNSITVHIKGLSVIGPVNTTLITITTPIVLANAKTRDYNYINGKLSLGTSKVDPNALLTVAGNASVRELKVKIDAGADFVFEDNYQKPDLTDVEQYIKLNRHLPSVASAKEMKSSGLEVGSFQIKLLQKIEELTLYMIDQNKKIKSQELLIDEMKIKMTSLSNRLETLKTGK